jgi:DNA-directed RNA polymerase specialized sigma24 family protein
VLTGPSPRRVRGTKRVPAPLKRLAALREAAARIAAAVERLDAEERAVLTLLLVEGMTPAEAAVTLGWTAERVGRTHRTLMAEVRRVFRGHATRTTRRGEGRSRIVTPLREAS